MEELLFFVKMKKRIKELYAPVREERERMYREQQEREKWLIEEGCKRPTCEGCEWKIDGKEYCCLPRCFKKL